MKKIFDIFSKKPSKESKEKPKAILDYREKNSLVPSELIHLGLEIEFRELKVADYIINGVAVERKTVSDFVSSMINKRLSKQLEELGQYSDKLLIIEGIDEQELYTDSEDRTGMHPNSIRGFLLSILLKYKVPIIFTKDYSDTAKFLSVLAKRKSKEVPLNINKKSLDKKERLQFILESFPGIGPKTAKKLLKKFRTIKNIINAPEEELREILGKKTEIIDKIINEKY
ncbi:MAG TPA: ERCC4 domain-containing protein [Bacillota bacterium]|nr:ERCC4 domain-containing protein [Bacillota bacterium]